MIYSSWDVECETETGNYGSYFALLSPHHKNQTKSKFWENEKECWRYHHFTHVHQKPQSYEVWLENNLENKKFEKNEKDIYRCLHFTHVYQKSRSYVCFLKYGVWQTLTTQKIKISKKCKKRLDIIILHKSTKNNDHMLYCFSDITRDGFVIFQFGLCFALLPL